MAWRFKASKYKNAAPIVPKPDACIRDICVGSYQTYGNNIAASAAFMAFNVDHNGSSLAVLPIDDCGRKSKTMPLLHAHSDTITDMDFSPFHDGLLATGSLDCLVKIWHIPEQGLEQSLSDAECTFSHRQRRVDTVGFHPTADFLLTTTSFTTLALWDLIQQQQILTNTEHQEVIQSVSWKKDGSLLATSCKDKQLRILDPRQETFTHSTNSHQSIKDSRVTWLGDQNRVLTTGFDLNRQREVFLRDLRNFDEPEKTLTLDSSTGILIPLFDPDTSMLFLAGKGDTSIQYLEVTDREPFLVEGLRHNGEQTKGACLVPKRALNVMMAEVNRVLQLTGSSVIPIMYQVPRKSYRDFHSDLFPDTSGNEPQITASQWIQGHNVPLPKINLDPSKRSNASLQAHRGNLAHLKEYLELHPMKQPTMTTASSKSNVNKNNPITPLITPKSQSTYEQQPEENGHHQNGQTTTPPKPLPRSSRTNSFSEEEPTPNSGGSSSTVPTTTRPIARPRTTASTEMSPPTAPSAQRSIGSVVTSVNPNAPIAGGYKPRLGPKPFTPPKFNFSSSADEKPDFSFDQVFSVPNAPETMNGLEKTQTPEISPQQTPNEPTPPQTPPPAEEEIESDQPIVPEAEPDSPEPAKTPSTAERRKLFEKKSSDDDEEKIEDFDRTSSTRSSIAERRRIYESRSLSVQDAGGVQSPTTPSPQPPRRRESFKKPDETSRPIPTQRQHTLDQSSRPSAPSSTPCINSSKPEPVTTPTPKRTSTVFGRVSKFRHLKGTPLHKSTHIENIRNISRQISGECDGFHANPDRVAVPLSGPGGKMAVFELSRTGKLPDGVIPALVHGTNIMDFAWDPFDNHRLAVACDDGSIKLWLIPEGGLSEPTNEPTAVLNGHAEKIYFIKWHPTARDVLTSGSYDMTVRIWNLETGADQIILTGHSDQMYALAWSPCGRYCATLSKDQRLRVYQPRKSLEPIREGKGPAGARGARLVWALDGNFLVTIGFDKASERQIQVFKWDDLKTPLNTVGLDVSPAILMPFYDEDSSTLFLTGKGDSTIYAFEITEEAPFICPLSHHRSSTLHQGLSFLPKCVCDVGSVEFARALRLTNNTIEPLSFTVPRIKSELFQDDLFPPTRVTWEPTLEGSQWFSGIDKPQQRISLKPEGMDSLSDIHGGSGDNKATKGAAVSASAVAPGSFPATQQPFNRLAWNAADIAGATKDKQEQIQRAVSSRMEVNMKLEQDEMEGVDEKEWDE